MKTYTQLIKEYTLKMNEHSKKLAIINNIKINKNKSGRYSVNVRKCDISYNGIFDKFNGGIYFYENIESWPRESVKIYGRTTKEFTNDLNEQHAKEATAFNLYKDKIEQLKNEWDAQLENAKQAAQQLLKSPLIIRALENYTFKSDLENIIHCDYSDLRNYKKNMLEKYNFTDSEKIKTFINNLTEETETEYIKLNDNETIFLSFNKQGDYIGYTYDKRNAILKTQCRHAIDNLVIPIDLTEHILWRFVSFSNRTENWLAKFEEEAKKLFKKIDIFKGYKYEDHAVLISSSDLNGVYFPNIEGAPVIAQLFSSGHVVAVKVL